MSDYVVAILSYRRDETLRDKTLPMLAAGGVDPSIVTVFVADDIDAAIYADTLDPATYGTIVTVGYDPKRLGTPGTGPGRAPVARSVACNALSRYYPAGTRVVSIDDDLTALYTKTGEQTRKPVDDVDAVITDMFDLADQHGARLWGVHPTPNAYFQRHTLATGLTFCIGAFHGVTLNGTDADLVATDTKDDYERSIRHYLADGNTIRANWLSPGMVVYAGAGGYQLSRNAVNETADAHWLVATYPDHVSLKPKPGRNGAAQLRLHRHPPTDPRPDLLPDLPPGT